MPQPWAPRDHPFKLGLLRIKIPVSGEGDDPTTRLMTVAMEEIMPHVYMKANDLEGEPLAGDGDCVALVKKYAPGLQGLPTSA